MNHYTEKQLEEADVQITERKDRESENWPRREGSASRKAIERTSTLIKAAVLLGGRYSPGRIDLPCGRYVLLTGQFGGTQIYCGWTPGSWVELGSEISPEYVARHIRKMLVEHDEYLLTNPQ